MALGWVVIIIYYGYKELLELYCATLTSIILSIEKEITFNTIAKNLYDFFLSLYETGLNQQMVLLGLVDFRPGALNNRFYSRINICWSVLDK